jgi:predicted dehydrogenase
MTRMNRHRKLRMALVGGGGQGFIGRVHAMAATLDQRAVLTAGALSSDPQKARQAAAEFGLAPDRAYGSYPELLAAESARPADERVDFVTIATPNHTHFDIARAAVRAGFHVVCEKPLTTDLDQAVDLAAQVDLAKVVFAVMYGYSGYPLVRQARTMVRGGELGEVQAVRVHYLQGGLRGLTPGQTPSRAAWKADPALAGPSGTLADIGTHAFHLARFITGLCPLEAACHLNTFHPVRPLDDYAHVVLRLHNGALGTITASQVTHGRLNDLAIEIDGTTGSLAWRQESPNQLILRRHGQPAQVYERNARPSYLDEATRRACRLPGGHPEGVLEAFANVYGDVFDDILARDDGGESARDDALYPSIHDGQEGVTFVQRCLASHARGGHWESFV